MPGAGPRRRTRARTRDPWPAYGPADGERVVAEQQEGLAGLGAAQAATGTAPPPSASRRTAVGASIVDLARGERLDHELSHGHCNVRGGPAGRE